MYKSHVYDLFDKIRDLDFGGVEDKKRIQRFLHLRTGINIRKPERAENFQGSHPMYDDINFSFPDINALPRMSGLYDQLLLSDSELEKRELLGRISEVNDDVGLARMEINDAVNKISAILAEVSSYNDLISQNHRFKVDDVTMQVPGKVGHAQAQNPYNQSVLRIRYMIINVPIEGTYRYYVALHLKDLHAAKAALDDAEFTWDLKPNKMG